MNYGKRKAEKIEHMQRRKTQDEIDELDFRPKILKYSEEIVRRRDAKFSDQQSLRSAASVHSRNSSNNS
jgi:hypothetical protein